MKIKALTSFAGTLSMYQGEIRDCDDMDTVSDLIDAGYVEEVKTAKASPKGVKKNESKRDH